MGQQEGWAVLAPRQLCPISCESAARALCLMEATHTRKHSRVLAMQTQLPLLCVCVSVCTCACLFVCSTCGSQMLMSSITSPPCFSAVSPNLNVLAGLAVNLQDMPSVPPDSLATTMAFTWVLKKLNSATMLSQQAFYTHWPSLSLFSNLLTYFCVHVHDVYMWGNAMMYAWRSADSLVESLPFLPLSRFWESNSVYGLAQQAPLLTEPSCWPSPHFLKNNW